jgi:hypothetical protein
MLGVRFRVPGLNTGAIPRSLVNQARPREELCQPIHPEGKWQAELCLG